MSFGVLLGGGLGLLICLCLVTLLCVGLIDCDYSVCLMLLVGTYCWLSGWLVVLVVAFCCCGLGICLWWGVGALALCVVWFAAVGISCGVGIGCLVGGLGLQITTGVVDFWLVGWFNSVVYI